MNPQIKLIIANTTATNPSMVGNQVPPRPTARIAPMIEMPEMAFAPDISGVCNVGGTLVITSNPTNMANTNITKSTTNASVKTHFIPQ